MTSRSSGRRQVSIDRINQRLDGFVLESRAHEDRRETLVDRRVTDQSVNQLLGDFLFGEQQLHQLVAIHRKRLEHVRTSLGGFVRQVSGNFFLANYFAIRCRRSRRPSW